MAVEPGGKPAVRRPVAAQCAVNPQENVLRQVFRLRAVARKPVANVEDAARMAAHKFLRTVALEALLDQLGILLQLSIASKPGGRPMHSLDGLHLGLPYNGTKSACKKFPGLCTLAADRRWAHLTGISFLNTRTYPK